MIFKLRRSPTAGFTLLEMLVVIVIAGVLFSIMAPGWVQFMNTRRVNGARDQILQALRVTQTEASRTRRFMAVTISTQPDAAGHLQVIANRPWRGGATPPAIELAPGQPETLGQNNFGGNIVTVGSNLDGTPAVANQITITFAPDGSVVSDINEQRVTDVSDDPQNKGILSIYIDGRATNTRRCLVLRTILGAISQEDPSQGNDSCPAIS